MTTPLQHDISASLKEIEAGDVEYCLPWDVRDTLCTLWDPAHEPLRIQFSIAGELPWSFGLTATFRKSIKSVDKKIQGRIVEALGDLCESPTTPQGDTIKPLGGEMLGLWRYRIGDYRLVYQPVVAQKRVFLLYFSPRGSAYD
jgi:mRNA interferase RelE/StbE